MGSCLLLSLIFSLVSRLTSSLSSLVFHLLSRLSSFIFSLVSHLLSRLSSSLSSLVFHLLSRLSSCLSVSVCCCGCCCGVLCLVCCVLCVVVCHAENPSPRVSVQNVPVCTGTTRTCIKTCARGAGTHGDILNGHTGGFSA